MFYEADKPHGLPHNPFKALVAPRPIGWVSTKSKAGVFNLAPYSFFSAIGDNPPMVAISSSGYKDTVANIDATGEFVCNMATYDLAQAMNQSSRMVEESVSEFDLGRVTPVPGQMIEVPRVREAKAALECKSLSVQRLVDLEGSETNQWLILGQVVGIHIDDSVLKNGLVDTSKLGLLSRLGYMDYAVIKDVFTLDRPV
ncbi:flavin reductase family protein [Flexibacterium corallicola]|uniref:flavin reductase family protein n=1 Tax=Flexibacterium corallicola TaxID=3037259 RepID=UPI00286F1A83|nr:flavin reductase family protein [Pseudovibrio sp. M1P-2-3]